MDISRRSFLQLGGAAATTAAVPGAWLSEQQRPPLSWRAHAPSQMPSPDIATLLLNRAAFGPRPGDVQRVRENPDAWIEQQLDYESIDDSAIEERLLAALPTLSMEPYQLLQYGDNENAAVQELRLATIYRMVFSPRLLYEVMVEFWSDHFHIYHPQNLCEYLKTVDDREVIRKHALGNFKDLLTASASSPAMLNYLDNDVNTKNRPNENYAREIMELHTVGVADSSGDPYTEQDVKEVAKCFTGWSWDDRQNSQTRGEFEYRDNDHYQGSKTVLGEYIPAGFKQQDGHEVIRILCEHEATPRFLATKLVRRFVTDDPLEQTPELVDRVADAYVRTGGEIRDMVSTVLRSREFAESFDGYGGRLSRPTDLLVRAMRGLDVKPDDISLDIRGRFYQAVMGRRGYLATTGHLPFYWVTPDGYPDVKEAWSASSVMLARWNLGLSLCGVGSGRSGELIRGFRPHEQTPDDISTAGEAVDYWIDRLLNRPLVDEDRQTIVAYLTDDGGDDTPLSQVRNRLPEAIALVLDSPYFQWR